MIFPMKKTCPNSAVRDKAAKALGRAGEDAACVFLRKKGFCLVERNWRPTGTHSGLELDIVARAGDILVFVEVKTRADARRIPVIAAFGAGKQKKMLAAARQYLAAQNAWHCLCRFDLVCVCGDGNSGFHIEHYEDVIENGQTLGGCNTAWQPW